MMTSRSDKSLADMAGALALAHDSPLADIGNTLLGVAARVIDASHCDRPGTALWAIAELIQPIDAVAADRLRDLGDLATKAEEAQPSSGGLLTVSVTGASADEVAKVLRQLRK